MGVKFNEKTQTFFIETKNTSYCIGIAGGKYLAHLYYGKKICFEDDLRFKMRLDENPFCPEKNERETLAFNDCFPWEFPCGGRGDFRESCVELLNEKNQNCAELEYCGYEILDEKPYLDGLPQTFCRKVDGASSVADAEIGADGAGTAGKSQTLLVKLEDKVLEVELNLFYSVFDDSDAIIKSAKIINRGKNLLKIKKIYSSSLTLENSFENQWNFISLHGEWARERHIEKTPLFHGRVNVKSLRGETSAQENNFFAIAEKTADYKNGEVYGFALLYSGNFIGQAEINQFETVRVVNGINSDDFLWNLNPGESFYTPETALIYSDCGFGKMSRSYHDLWRNHLIRGKYFNKMRPVLINNWEATYFNFDTQKLLSIAGEAAKSGIEMLVMDDGWFSKRSDDTSSLGDWTVNEEKIKGGLKFLVDKVNALGLKFGIWFEPEMVSKNSELFRQHPEWILHVNKRIPVLSRAQYVLDITNPEVFDYVYSSVAKILKSANIEYVKWDMNRNLTDVGSSVCESENSGEVFHKYVLALYKMQEKLLCDFPDLLLENCSAGGSRFDAGMLYYSPQIWTSDDCDAIERLEIQEGTSLCYPLSSMGSHIASSPSHTTGRSVPFLTRGFVALSGTFGYELDITKLCDEEKALIPGQIEMFKKYNSLVMNGDYYRIESASGNHQFDTWECVSKDKTEALVVMIQVLNRPNFKSRIVRLEGLAEEKKYEIQLQDSFGKTGEKFVLSGATLMNLGLKLPRFQGDFAGLLIHLRQV